MSSELADQERGYQMSNFQSTLDYIRSTARTAAEQGRLFERLMKTYFEQDPLYQERFSQVQLWSDWAAAQQGFVGTDMGIDLVAEEEDGGHCAIQCKCFAPGTRISKPQLDSFISASARDPFTARILVDTGDEWGSNAVRTVIGLKPTCSVLRFDDLASRPFDWPDLSRQEPEELSLRREEYRLRWHQQEALNDVIKGFETQDRGKLIMACGTGKTFTALRIAERLVGEGGSVLYLVPSISLLQQSMREWADHHKLTHRYVGICSDAQAGRTDEDASLEELEMPVTTEPRAISDALRRRVPNKMTVVFCTYHSLRLIELAQDDNAPDFDLILCDEAHRTTGIDRPNDDASPFVLVHDSLRIRGDKRLYMTATPRLYTEGAKAKAAKHSVEVFSMDDEETFGEELYNLPFSRAVEKGLLADYKVVVLALSESQIDKALQEHIASEGGEINLSDAAKIFGCWRALQDPENRGGGTVRIRRAIAFTDRIKSSQLLAKHWSGLVDSAIDYLPKEERESAFRCETNHVDGKHNALERKALIKWLNDAPDHGACRILSNARCLSEGIDVPALDAVLFMTERKSVVDIVQAVGRVMRKAESKSYGYIVLPIAVAADRDPAQVLERGKEFDVVWSVLRALRSHDDRLNAEINQIDLNDNPTDRIIFNLAGDGGETEGGSIGGSIDWRELPFPPMEFPAEAFYARIVEKCGDRKYWENWAKDVAKIFAGLVTRINNLLDDSRNKKLIKCFETFHAELKGSINESISASSAIDMIAQHILTCPVFEALFEDYDFASGNPVSHALDKLRKDFVKYGLENETRDLEGFYESVRLRTRGLDNPDARQDVLKELYEKFFATAMKKESDRLGIVYTPVEIVDFVLASAEHAVRTEFGKSLSDKDIHVLDPFTGTGIFLVRLLQSGLIDDSDLKRKYRNELHANELVLLAYYIAAICIEEAYHGRVDDCEAYEPFGGIVLTDTFNLHTERSDFPKDWLSDNNERVERQQSLPIQVIVGNPPWSAGQRRADEENPNVAYPEMAQRISDTYADRSTATLLNSLYDTYKMAIRWASDRIGEKGVLAFVTNGSFIDSNADSGLRACLEDEFSSIHILNLRGNTRTSGELARREGGKVFGQGSRATVAITVLVKNPDMVAKKCRILYHDIGDYLSRDEKLRKLHDWNSIAGIEKWESISPDQHFDWINQRNASFQSLYPLGSKDTKAGRDDTAIFHTFCNGYKSGRDEHVYNFSKCKCQKNAFHMVKQYCDALTALEKNPQLSIDDIVRDYASFLRWDRKMRSLFERRVAANFSKHHTRISYYRPYIKQYLYADSMFSQLSTLQSDFFPPFDNGNRAICVSGISSATPFTALIIDTVADLSFVSNGQCFPRFRYAKNRTKQSLPGINLSHEERMDNITESSLRDFRLHYLDNGITKDMIFDYIYGFLHSPDYKKKFSSDLSKEMPRISFADDFYAFAEAGRHLAELHLGYETCPQFPLREIFHQQSMPKPNHYLIGSKPMRFDKNDSSVLIVNDHLRLEGIPPKAHEYRVNGRTPLEWFIDRYKLKKGSDNDPNDWFKDPQDLVKAIRRIVHVSVESASIITALPSPFPTQKKQSGRKRRG